MKQYTERFRTSYDTAAEAYARDVFHELDHKPFDRSVLDQLAADVQGRVADIGCGPGHVARYLYERGVDVTGIDLSPQMIEVARRLTPEVEFQQGNMLDLASFPSGAFAGIVALYSLIHIERPDIPTALSELHRLLAPGGLLLLSFHKGTHTVHADNLWNVPVDLDFFFFEPEEMEAFLQQAGFLLDARLERAPYPGVEAETHRVYLRAHKPAA